MARISTATKNKLNKSDRACKDALLGTRLYNMGTLTCGSYTAVAADASGSSITIQTGQTGVAGFLVQTFRSGSRIYATKCISTGSNLTITSSASSTWTIATGDIIEWLVF